jgi:uncharacterized protein YbaP (TraB family)
MITTEKAEPMGRRSFAYRVGLKAWFFFVSVSLLTAPVHAQDQSRKHFLWELQAGASHVYLLGSIHSADRSLYPLAPVIEDAFAQAQFLVLEFDIGQVQSLSSQQAILSQALLSKGTLRDLFSKTEYTRLKADVERYGLDLDSFGPFKPWFVSIAMLQEGLQKLGFKPEYGIDFYFHQRAEGKIIIELESLDEQIQLLAGWDMEKQKLMLQYTVNEMEALEKHFGQIISAWKSGDAAALERQVFGSQRTDPRMTAVYDRIFRDRNAAMAQKLSGMFQREPGVYFVVVGAGHLIGDQGLVALLRKKGYAVDQL